MYMEYIAIDMHGFQIMLSTVHANDRTTMNNELPGIYSGYMLIGIVDICVSKYRTFSMQFAVTDHC